MFLFRNIISLKAPRDMPVGTEPQEEGRYSMFDTTQSPGGSPKHTKQASATISQPKFNDVHNKPLCSFGKKGKGKGQLIRPGGVTITSEGDIAVVDTENCRIQLFSPTGHLKKTISEKGYEDHQLNQPMDIAVIVRDGTECVIVTDSVNACLKIFDLTGACLHLIESESGTMEYPYGICVSRDQHIIVTDLLHHSVIVFDSSGNQSVKFGRYGDGASEFDNPYSVTATGDNRIVVSDYGNMAIKIFTIEGDVLYNFSVSHFHIYQEEDFVQLQGLTVDSDGNILVVGNSAVYVVANNGRFWEAFLPCECLTNPKGLAFAHPDHIVISQEATAHEDQVFVFEYCMENFRSLGAVPKPKSLRKTTDKRESSDGSKSHGGRTEVKPTPYLDSNKRESHMSCQTQVAAEVHAIPQREKETKKVTFSDNTEEYKITKSEKGSPKRSKKNKKSDKKYPNLKEDYIIGRQVPSLDYELIERKRRMKARAQERVSPAHIFNFT